MKCSIGDGYKKLPPSRSGKSSSPHQSRESPSPPKLSPTRPPPSSKRRSSKAFTQMKIRDEVKIDLRKSESSDRVSLRSACKIYPIDEISENASRTSSKMRIKQIKKRQEVQRIVEENKSRAKCRPGNANKYSSMMQLHDEVEIYKPLFYRSSQLIIESAFQDQVARRPSRSPTRAEDCYYNRFELLSFIKRSQIQKLPNDCPTYQEQKQLNAQKLDDTYKLLTIRSCPSSEPQRPTSCFGCFTKPLAKMCNRKSRKY